MRENCFTAGSEANKFIIDFSEAAARNVQVPSLWLMPQQMARVLIARSTAGVLTPGDNACVRIKLDNLPDNSSLTTKSYNIYCS